MAKEAKQVALKTLPPVPFHVHQPYAKSTVSIPEEKAKIQLMTPIFKSQLRLQKWLIQEIFLFESFHEQ